MLMRGAWVDEHPGGGEIMVMGVVGRLTYDQEKREESIIEQ